MPIEGRAPDERFDNRVAQIAFALFSTLIGLIGLAMLAESRTRVPGALFVLLGGFFAVRALRSSTVVVTESGVSMRSVIHTRRYSFSELRGVEVVVGRTGFNGFGREYLVLHRADGVDVAFKELNCPPPKDTNASSVVRRAAASIWDRLQPD